MNDLMQRIHNGSLHAVAGLAVLVSAPEVFSEGSPTLAHAVVVGGGIALVAAKAIAAGTDELPPPAV